MTIETISSSDASLIAHLYKRCFTKAMREEDVAHLLARSKMHGFKIKDHAFLLVRTVSDETEIIDIGVDPDARGQGLAQKLISHLKTLSHSIFLEVNSNNIPALSLYRKMGFEQIALRKKYYDGKDDAIVMVFKN